jgi:hypothetical protein
MPKNCIFARLHHGAVAQLVEQRTENPCVGGSIPSRTTFFSHRICSVSGFERQRIDRPFVNAD